MPLISDYKLGHKYMGLWKGDPGVGKSVAAGSFPDPIYFFDFDGRMEPVVRYWQGKKDIEYDTYHANNFERFDSKLEGFVTGKHRFKTIVGDSLTAISNATLAYQITLRGTSKIPKGSGGLDRGIIETPDVSDYGGEINYLNAIIDALRKLDSHVILTAHVLTTESSNVVTREKIVTKTLLTGGKKIAAAIPAYFNEVWNFISEPQVDTRMQPVRKVYTSAGGVDYAKTALPLPTVLTIPSNGDLFSVIQNELAKTGNSLRT